MLYKVIPNILKSKTNDKCDKHKTSKDGRCVRKYEDKAKRLNKDDKQKSTAFSDDWDNWFPWEV
jgi:hypothetical protein